MKRRLHPDQPVLNLEINRPITRIVRPISDKEGIGSHILDTFSRKSVVRAKVSLNETVSSMNHGGGNFRHVFSATVTRNSAKWGHRLGEYSSSASYRDPEIEDLWREIMNYIKEGNNSLTVGSLECVPTHVTDVYRGEFTVSRRNPFQ